MGIINIVCVVLGLSFTLQVGMIKILQDNCISQHKSIKEKKEKNLLFKFKFAFSYPLYICLNMKC